MGAPICYGTPMAFASGPDGARLYYEVHGAGEPVLLITGLGMNAYGWERTIPWLAERHLVVALDNRGTGRSDVPPGPYTVRQMAGDAAAVLEAAGQPSAHVVAASLGGMIAQRLALDHRDRVRSLVLLCTMPGGQQAVVASEEVRAALVQGGPDAATVYRRNAWFLYGEETRTMHPERIEEDIVSRARIPTRPAGYLAQLQAAMTHDAWDELPSLDVPTLVVHGDADLLVPTANASLLAARIPGAELRLIPGAGHMLQADANDAVRAAVLDFLARVSPRTRRSPAPR
jgi:pimeloyl-ACP methyl ester carboxylesterase